MSASVWAGTSLLPWSKAYAASLASIVQLATESVVVHRIELNYHEGVPDAAVCEQPPSPKLRCTSVGGMKVAFWRHVFTPAEVEAGGFTHLWLFDSDLRVQLFGLPSVLTTMHELGAAMAQPSVKPPVPGGRSTDVDFLRSSTTPSSPTCVALEVPIVEVMTPVVDVAAWAGLHTHLLEHWPASALEQTDHILNDVWCRFIAWKLRWPGPPCILLRNVTIVHGDTRMIEEQHLQKVRRHNPNLTKAFWEGLVEPFYIKHVERAGWVRHARCWSQGDAASGRFVISAQQRRDALRVATSCHEFRRKAKSNSSCADCMQSVFQERQLPHRTNSADNACRRCFERGYDCLCICPRFNFDMQNV